MSRALAHRLRRLEERWVLQMARRLETLPPLVLLAADLDCEPEQLPPPEACGAVEDERSAEEHQAWERLEERTRHRTPHACTRALAQRLLIDDDSPVNQRLLRVLARYEARPPEA